MRSVKFLVAAERTRTPGLADSADDVVSPHRPEPFYAVGLWYDDFTQTTDEEVHDLLDRSDGPAAGRP